MLLSNSLVAMKVNNRTIARMCQTRKVLCGGFYADILMRHRCIFIHSHNHQCNYVVITAVMWTQLQLRRHICKDVLLMLVGRHRRLTVREDDLHIASRFLPQPKFWQPASQALDLRGFLSCRKAWSPVLPGPQTRGLRELMVVGQTSVPHGRSIRLPWLTTSWLCAGLRESCLIPMLPVLASLSKRTGGRWWRLRGALVPVRRAGRQRRSIGVRWKRVDAEYRDSVLIQGIPRKPESNTSPQLKFIYFPGRGIRTCDSNVKDV